MKRRAFLDVVRRGAPGLVLATGASAYGLGYEPSALRLEQPVIALPGLPPAFDGLRVALLTDLHVGPFTRPVFVTRAVEMANAARPDVTVLLGDYVHRGPRHFAPCAEALSALRAPMGVFAVTGNHDYWDGIQHCERAFHGSGIRFLRNEALALERGPDHLWLAGVDDLLTRNADPEAALLPIPRGDRTVLLSHNPDLVELLDPPFAVDLMLSGHTHGGQVRLPVLGSPVVPSRFGQRYASGLARKGQTAVYVSRGIGTISPTVRINCPPEVTLLTLKAQSTT